MLGQLWYLIYEHRLDLLLHICNKYELGYQEISLICVHEWAASVDTVYIILWLPREFEFFLQGKLLVTQRRFLPSGYLALYLWRPTIFRSTMGWATFFSSARLLAQICPQITGRLCLSQSENSFRNCWISKNSVSHCLLPRLEIPSGSLPLRPAGTNNRASSAWHPNYPKVHRYACSDHRQLDQPYRPSFLFNLGIKVCPKLNRLFG